ncbi:hypothetical protein HZS_5535 [Henneguya salminicola]|nr:hypothetical protein HZS_5535 [Henneguya salminicola]
MTIGNPLNKDMTARMIEAYNRWNSCQQKAEIIDHNRKSVPNVVKRYFLTEATRTIKNLIPTQEIKIKDYLDENCTISLKSVANKCMLEFCFMIFKSQQQIFSLIFIYTLKQIHIFIEGRNTGETIK